MDIGKPKKPVTGNTEGKRKHSGLSVNAAPERARPHLDKAKAMLKTHVVEEFFEDKMARLDTTIPLTIKRDLNELLECVDTKSVNSRNTANRLIVEALTDLFRKYQDDKGLYSMVDDLHFKGRY
jgi:hypothetical protein